MFTIKFWLSLAGIGAGLGFLTNVTNLYDLQLNKDAPRNKSLLLEIILATIWGAVAAVILVFVLVVAVPSDGIQAILIAIAGGFYGKTAVDKIIRKTIKEWTEDIDKLQDLDILSKKWDEIEKSHKDELTKQEWRDHDN